MFGPLPDTRGGADVGALPYGTTAQDFAQLQDFFLETKVIKAKLADPSKYLIGTPDFFDAHRQTISSG